MSAYKKIVTQFRNGQSLEKALKDLGITFSRGSSLTENSQVLKTSWGASYGGSDQPCAIAIQKKDAVAAGIGNFDGLGFFWNGKGYDLIQDHYDENDERIACVMNKLRQRYGYHEVVRQARARGYNVQQTIQENGTIRITLVRR